MSKKEADQVRRQKYRYNRICLGMNKYNAARAAGYSKSTALSASRLEDMMKDELKDILEQKGYTDKKIIEFIEAGLAAQKPVGELLKMFPDWAIRHKYLETLLQLTDRLKSKFESAPAGGGTKVVVIYPEGYKPKESTPQPQPQGLSNGSTDQAQPVPSRISVEY